MIDYGIRKELERQKLAQLFAEAKTRGPSPFGGTGRWLAGRISRLSGGERRELRRGRQERWEAMFFRLELFAKRRGHTWVPAAHIERGSHLGLWVSHVRAAYQLGTLTHEQIGRLEALPGWVWETAPQAAPSSGPVAKPRASSVLEQTPSLP